MKKSLLAFCLMLLVITIAGTYWLRGNVDSLVKSAITKYGTAMAGAPVTLREAEFKATDGRGILKDLRIGNPAGFKTSHALRADSIELEIDLASLSRDVVKIKRITVTAPDVIYEKGDGITNFDALQKNIGLYLGSSDNSGVGKKLIVQELVILDAKVQASAAFMNGKTISLRLPDIHLHDLGKAKGGLSPGELGLEITNALERRLHGAVNFEKLTNSVSGALGRVGDAIKGIFK